MDSWKLKLDEKNAQIFEAFKQLHDGAITAEEFYNYACARMAEFAMFVDPELRPVK